MHFSLITLIVLTIAPFVPSIVQATPTPEPAPAPAPEPWRSTHGNTALSEKDSNTRQKPKQNTHSGKGDWRKKKSSTSSHADDRDRYKPLGDQDEGRTNRTSHTKGSNKSNKAHGRTVKMYADEYYDDSMESKSVTCSGVTSQGGKFVSLDGFPFMEVGASPFILQHDRDSDYCVTCWEITYGETVRNVTMIDSSRSDWVISQSAFGRLTEDNAVLGAIDVQVKMVQQGRCVWYWY